MSNMDRRNFMQASLVGAAGLAIASAPQVALGKKLKKRTKVEKDFNGSLNNDVDVLVVGGGTAGAIAAIQAARTGAKTLIVERNAQLGGTMTTGGVAWPGLFGAWGKQVIDGVGWELVKESVELDGGELLDFAEVQKPHWKNQIHINQFLYSILAEEKCEQAGVDIAYYESPTQVTKTANGWTVICSGFGTERTVKCKQIIDCTGGAEVVGMMGGKRLREDEIQPGSFLFMIGSLHTPGRKECQRLYVHGADSTNSQTVTAANLTGRKATLKRLRDLRKKHKDAQIMHMQPETSFRESYRIEGEAFITEADFMAGKVYDDAVCYSFYPIDLHTSGKLVGKKLKPGVVPTVPLGALAPKGIDNVLVAGRCVSSDRLANSALRVQSSCMAMAQAAGVAAALAAKQNKTPLKVSLSEIRRELTKHKAIVPGAKKS